MIDDDPKSSLISLRELIAILYRRGWMIVLPLVLALAIALAAQGWWRGALVWLGVIGATFSVMLALKLTFLACTPVFRPMDIRSPSGHVAAATFASASSV